MMIKIVIGAKKGERGSFEALPRRLPLLEAVTFNPWSWCWNDDVGEDENEEVGEDGDDDNADGEGDVDEEGHGSTDPLPSLLLVCHIQFMLMVN